MTILLPVIPSRLNDGLGWVVDFGASAPTPSPTSPAPGQGGDSGALVLSGLLSGQAIAAYVGIVSAIVVVLLGNRAKRTLDRSLQTDLQKLRAQGDKELEAAKGLIQKEMEVVKSSLSKERVLYEAALQYRYDALKRGYRELGPLLFQFYSVGQDLVWLASNISCRTDAGQPLLYEDSLDGEEECDQLVYGVCASVAVANLMSRNVSAVDLRVDHSLAAQFLMIRMLARKSFFAPLEVGSGQNLAEPFPRSAVNLLAVSLEVHSTSTPSRILTAGEFEDREAKGPQNAAYAELKAHFRAATRSPRCSIWHGLLRVVALHRALSRLAENDVGTTILSRVGWSELDPEDEELVQHLESATTAMSST